MPVLLKKSIRTYSAEYESLIMPGYSQGFKPMPPVGKTKGGVQDFLHTPFCFVSFRYCNDIALSKRRADNPSSSHSPSHVHV